MPSTRLLKGAANARQRQIPIRPAGFGEAEIGPQSWQSYRRASISGPAQSSLPTELLKERLSGQTTLSNDLRDREVLAWTLASQVFVRIDQLPHPSASFLPRAVRLRVESSAAGLAPRREPLRGSLGLAGMRSLPRSGRPMINVEGAQRAYLLRVATGLEQGHLRGRGHAWSSLDLARPGLRQIDLELDPEDPTRQPAIPAHEKPRVCGAFLDSGGRIDP